MYYVHGYIFCLEVNFIFELYLATHRSFVRKIDDFCLQRKRRKQTIATLISVSRTKDTITTPLPIRKSKNLIIILLNFLILKNIFSLDNHLSSSPLVSLLWQHHEVHALYLEALHS